MAINKALSHAIIIFQGKAIIYLLRQSGYAFSLPERCYLFLGVRRARELKQRNYVMPKKATLLFLRHWVCILP